MCEVIRLAGHMDEPHGDLRGLGHLATVDHEVPGAKSVKVQSRDVKMESVRWGEGVPRFEACCAWLHRGAYQDRQAATLYSRVD